MKTQQFHLGSGGVLQAQLSLGNFVPSAQLWSSANDHGVVGLVSTESLHQIALFRRTTSPETSCFCSLLNHHKDLKHGTNDRFLKIHSRLQKEEKSIKINAFCL